MCLFCWSTWLWLTKTGTNMELETWTKTCGLPLLFNLEPHPLVCLPVAGKTACCQPKIFKQNLRLGLFRGKVRRSGGCTGVLRARKLAMSFNVEPPQKWLVEMKPPPSSSVMSTKGSLVKIHALLLHSVNTNTPRRGCFLLNCGKTGPSVATCCPGARFALPALPGLS